MRLRAPHSPDRLWSSRCCRAGALLQAVLILIARCGSREVAPQHTQPVSGCHSTMDAVGAQLGGGERGSTRSTGKWVDTSVGMRPQEGVRPHKLVAWQGLQWQSKASHAT